MGTEEGGGGKGLVIWDRDLCEALGSRHWPGGTRFKNNSFAVMRSTSEEGAYSRLVDLLYHLIQEQLLRSNEQQFRGGLVFKARRLVVSLDSRPRVIKKKKKGLVRGSWKSTLKTISKKRFYFGRTKGGQEADKERTRRGQGGPVKEKEGKRRGEGARGGSSRIGTCARLLEVATGRVAHNAENLRLGFGF